ncbi:adenosylcobinamide-phosphate synthase CbiB [Niallia sp. NCCP-28]|uniref:adenosylcobinamide-phosphate synthase CbiB n=1 Tax=Niallia sp. NCCP-28 TaxID=2934712 RepID=UPI0020892557|nr:adenosylcobinamide-phosphate synthase CbiB [Niallia sp. NCCP-28]GKU84663.1 cobalamin biosynthesis protein CobD [Niallia sp. NCCP-28]
MFYHLISITIAVIIDKIVGDPSNWPHPVKWMGSMIAVLENLGNKGKNRKLKGLCMLLFVVFITYLVSVSIISISYSFHSLVGILVESCLIATTIAQKSLKTAALDVYKPLMKKDLATARLKLSYIVGRDTDKLTEDEIVRATVETVAENTSDGITAPLFWALIGGAPLSLVYRAINTCDSMVGYQNSKFAQFGYFSAKFDDVVNLLPSRITAILLLLFSQPVYCSKREAWGLLFSDAKKHPSPNSGWGESATAIILGIQLGGINYYKGQISNRAKMGLPQVKRNKAHIIASNTLMEKATLLFLLFLWIGGSIIEFAISWG